MSKANITIEMALRVFYPSSQCVRSHPYWELVDDFFLPQFQVRSCRRNKIDGGWDRILRELLQLEEPTNKNQTKPDNTADKNDDKFTYDLELSGFNPENIKVKTVGQKVVVEANQEESKDEHGCKSYSKREVHKSIVLPDNVRPEDVISALSSKGVLRITAPVMSLTAPEEKELEIEIEQEKKEEKQEEVPSKDELQ